MIQHAPWKKHGPFWWVFLFEQVEHLKQIFQEIDRDLAVGKLLKHLNVAPGIMKWRCCGANMFECDDLIGMTRNDSFSDRIFKGPNANDKRMWLAIFYKHPKVVCKV